jgi:hypothetical protein
MSYYLFLDDERYPVNRKGEGDQMSAYELTGNKKYFLLDWVIVRDFGEFVKTIEEKGLPNIISFDHDLKDEHYYHYRMFTVYTGWIDYTILEGTGFECAKWLINYMMNNNLKCPEILIHTQNTVGAKNIHKEFENFKKSNK